MRKAGFLLALVLGWASSLAAEEGAVTWTFQSAKANEAIRKYQAARKKLDEAYEKNRHENRASLIEKLQQEVKTATKSSDLDDALAIREAIKAINSAASDTPEKKAAPVASRPRTAIKKDLLEQIRGNWNVSVRGVPGEVWTFNRDYTVVITGSGTGHGRWLLDNDRVYITWLHRANGWDALKFPLDQMPVAGDSWAGADILRAVKAGEGTGASQKGNQPKSDYLDEIPEIGHSLKYRLEKKGKMTDGEKQTTAAVRGQEFAHSLFTHPGGNGSPTSRSMSTVQYNIGGAYHLFKGSVAIVDDSPKGTPITFGIVGDGRMLWQSKPVAGPRFVQKFSVDIRNVNKLVLQIDCPGPNSWRQAIWLNPELTRQ